MMLIIVNFYPRNFRKIKKKQNFKSDILDHNDQDELFNLVDKIEIFKGKTNE